MEERRFEQLEDYNVCVGNLESLRRQRSLVLAGTIGCAALIISNINASTELLMTGTVVFPSLMDYLTNIQNEINRNQREKNAYINGETIVKYKDTVEIEYDLNEHIPDLPGYTVVRKSYSTDKVVVTYTNTEYIYKKTNSKVGKPLKRLTKQRKYKG